MALNRRFYRVIDIITIRCACKRSPCSSWRPLGYSDDTPPRFQLDDAFGSFPPEHVSQFAECTEGVDLLL
jgi:hypothetical protein